LSVCQQGPISALGIMPVLPKIDTALQVVHSAYIITHRTLSAM